VRRQRNSDSVDGDGWRDGATVMDGDAAMDMKIQQSTSEGGDGWHDGNGWRWQAQQSDRNGSNGGWTLTRRWR